MKIVFVSNFLNHHQLPLCKAFAGMTHVEFHFIAAEPVPEMRLKLGYRDMNSEFDFVIRTYDSEEEKQTAYRMIQEADVMICGEDPGKYVKNKKQLVFWFSERILRKKRRAGNA